MTLRFRIVPHATLNLVCPKQLTTNNLSKLVWVLSLGALVLPSVSTDPKKEQQNVMQELGTCSCQQAKRDERGGSAATSTRVKRGETLLSLPLREVGAVVDTSPGEKEDRERTCIHYYWGKVGAPACAAATSTWGKGLGPGVNTGAIPLLLLQLVNSSEQ